MKTNLKTLLILTTSGCKNCPPVLDYLHTTSHGCDAIFMGDTHKDFTKNVEAHGAVSAPTVILFGECHPDGSMDELGRAGDVEELKELLTKYKDESI